MFGSKSSGQLRGCLAALAFVWAAAIAGTASADANKVTICHIPPGNPANYQQITVAPAAVPAHLAHGDFILTTGSCATDCNVNTTLCNTPPDHCHQAGTCVASTGLCEFPLQPDFTACKGMDGLSCDSCQDGACISVSSCAGVLNISTPNGQYDYCSPANGGNCTEETVTCPPPPASSYNNSTSPPTQCYAIAVDPALGQCIETCAATICGDGSPTICGNVAGCQTDADCTPETLGNTGLPDKCQTGSCGPDKLCVWSPVSCGPPATGPNQPVHACDPAYGCFEETNTAPAP